MLTKRTGLWPAICLVISTVSLNHVAHADTAPVSFDRPGIGFSTAIMPADHVAWEQGLPDIMYSKDKINGNSVKTTVYQADTLIRTGLGSNVELQLGWAGATWLRSSSSAGSQQQFGYADSSIGLKAAVPLTNQQLSLAFLLATTLNTGDAEFGDDKKTLSFGSTLNYDINDAYSAALYANLDRYDGDNTWTVSPSLSLALTDSVASFVEYGYSKTQGQPQQSVMGGGFTWAVSPKIQLDVSADVGLNQDTPDMQGGFGVSFSFP
jgi:hypothetical protein